MAAEDKRIWPLHQKAVSFILLNISRLPDDYLEFIQQLDTTVVTAYRNQLRERNFPCHAESQCSGNHFDAIVTGSSVEGLCMDNVIHYPSMFTAGHRQMEDGDIDCMLVDRRFVATQKLDGEMKSRTPTRLRLETAKHQPGYCSLTIDKGIYNEAIRKGKDKVAD